MTRKRKLHLCFLLIAIFAFFLAADRPAKLQAWADQKPAIATKKPVNTKTTSRTNTKKTTPITPAAAKSALQNWVFLCAPCHSIQATGTDFGPALLGELAKRRYTRTLLLQIFADPGKHGLSEALPAFRKLKQPQRRELALWFSTLKTPTDISIESSLVKPPPFVFVQNCAGCHGADAFGGIGPNLHKVIQRRNRDELLTLIENPRNAGVKTQIMPTFEELTVEERTLIVDWLQTLE